MGNFSDIDLNKRLAGKQVSCSVGLASDNEIQLNILQISDLIRTDLSQLHRSLNGSDLRFYVTRSKATSNAELDPDGQPSQNTLTEAVYQNNPRTTLCTRWQILTKISYPGSFECSKNASAMLPDFVFAFVGSIEYR